MSINTYAFLDSSAKAIDIVEWIVGRIQFLEVEYSMVDGSKSEYWIKHPDGKTIWMNVEVLPSSNVYSSHFTKLACPPWIVSLDSSAGRREIDLLLMYLIPWLLIQHSHGLGAVDPQLGSELVTQETEWLRVAKRAFSGFGYDFLSVFEKSKVAEENKGVSHRNVIDL